RVLPPLRFHGQTVSSSAIRELLRDGDAVHAAELLGHPYAITGVVLRGAGRGRTLGFPTANLQPDRPLVLAPGVYVARASWGRARATVGRPMRWSMSATGRPSARTSTGSRPTCSTSRAISTTGRSGWSFSNASGRR